MRKLLLMLVGFWMGMQLQAQSPAFQLALEEVEIKDLPGLQSFAAAVWGNDILLIGGRTDGLHRRQPFASFDAAGKNGQIVVLSTVHQQAWAADLSDLSATLQDQLSATNLEFFQDNRSLYVLGGYGYCPSQDEHLTFPYLTAIDVPGLIKAVKNAAPIDAAFRQLEDSLFAITGGELERIGDTYYLVGGHKFTGRYNPMGPDHGPGFVQVYNHAILPFTIEDDGHLLIVHHGEAVVDTAVLHRRDYNLMPQIMPDGQEGLVAFSGVFQYIADIPYLNLVEIDPQGYKVVPQFQQHYQQYHCANIAMYSQARMEMHNVFLGGIGTYYDSAGVHVLDCNVPFVKTVSRVSRDAKGNYEEYKLPWEMPAYLGASAEFIPLEGLPRYPNGVLQMEAMEGPRALIGYIVGGIESSDDNIFWVNEGEHSKASTRVYKVLYSHDPDGTADIRNIQSTHPFQLEVIPDPFKALLFVDFQLQALETVDLTLTDEKGKSLIKLPYKPLTVGHQHLEIPCKRLKKGGRFFFNIASKTTSLRLKLVVEL